LNEFTNKKEWKLTKIVLPQHTDHAGVMWHGSYFHFLEEGRIDALDKIGITYSKLSERGYEIPVISAQIKYRIPFTHGENLLLISQFNLVNKIRLNCKTLFFKVNGDIGAEALIELVIVRKINQKIKLVRELPAELEKMFVLLEEG
tara:strand:- start:216 stop:653 length:438 start_codon:yes stop_codon:yes gene_type:complete